MLLDLMMPIVDGYEFRRRQHQDPVIRDVPVVCISGTHNAAEAAERIRAVACIEKPIEIHRLVDVLRTWCASA